MSKNNIIAEEIVGSGTKQSPHTHTRVGIFFGGPSREREISFAGGRTVYDNLDREFFEPVPVFVDSLGNFILLDWQHLYKGSIRDFYPPQDLTPKSIFQVYIESLGELDDESLSKIIDRVGTRIMPHQFSEYFDFAFLVLHGPYGEDGVIQGLLEWFNIPYSGTGILGAALGIDKVVQKQIMERAGFAVPKYYVLNKNVWSSTIEKEALFENIVQQVGCPLVVKSPRQGSSIGVSIIKEKDITLFSKAINSSLFIQEIEAHFWASLTEQDKEQWIAKLIDIRDGIGLPVTVENQVIHHPDDLMRHLNEHFTNSDATLHLQNLQGEDSVLIEAYINGREFSCIVLEDIPGQPMALPPTEMIKGETHFDYRAKYLPGIVHKETPMQLSDEQLAEVREQCVRLFKVLNFQVYARIDGFITKENQIILNDPNTTVGMNPSSFLFHQAAEIGLNPKQLLTFIIKRSFVVRTSFNKSKLNPRKK